MNSCLTTSLALLNKLIIIIIIIIIDTYKTQYPLIAQNALQYNNMLKTTKKKYTEKTIVRYKKID